MKNRIWDQGFTLIEIIGVLAIISILATAIVPNIAREISRSITNTEDQSLTTISDALARSSVENRMIPDITNGEWDSLAAFYLTLSKEQIVQNRIGENRRLISRPTNGLNGVPYDQSSQFSFGALSYGALPTNAPLQARMLLVSSLQGAVSARNISDAQFDAIWEQNGGIPAGFDITEKLRIERISFTSQFYPVTVNCTNTTNTPSWSLDAAPAKDLATESFTVYLFTGTRINLFINTVPSATVVVDRALGLSYDGAAWSY